MTTSSEQPASEQVIKALLAEEASQEARMGEEDADDRVYLARSARHEIERLRDAVRFAHAEIQEDDCCPPCKCRDCITEGNP